MRLYRGLKETYRSERRPDGLVGADFTDCPYTATLYAYGRRGQVLVLDIPDDKPAVRVSRALWLDEKAERLMVWGKFDDYMVGMIPAKELRRRVRAKGMGAMPDSYKSDVLKGAIDEALRRASDLPILTLGGDQEKLASFQAEARRARVRKPRSTD
jgi:hypothetical protein